MSSNFDFLSVHDERLVTFGLLAERYFRDDPSTSLMKLRQFAELTARLVSANHATYRGPQESFDEVLRRLSYDRTIPKEVSDIFHALRKAGNAAVHEGTGRHAEALTALKLARSLGIWFHRTYGKQASFQPIPFFPPPVPVDATLPLREEIARLNQRLEESETGAAAARKLAEEAERKREDVQERLAREIEDRAAWEQLAQETDADRAELAAKLEAIQVQAATTSPAMALELVQRGEEAAAKLDLDEAETRALVDQQLRDRGWEVDTRSLRHSAGIRPAKGRNLAIAEWPTAHGPADYALFVGTAFVGVVEAKRKRKNISASIDQAERYSLGVGPGVDYSLVDGSPWHGHGVPFVFATNGRSYLKQIETESGIWFRDTRRKANHRRALVDWPTPQGLVGLLEVDQDAAAASLAAEPFAFGFPLRPYQEQAIRAVETALAADKRTMLIAMATGTGKTKLAIAMLYRLLAAKRFRHICFVVDRSALGEQAEGEFSTTKVVSGKTFADIFGLKGLEEVAPELDTKVHICTIQGLVRRVLFAADTSESPPVDQYDLMVIDECHRGYLLDREMSDSELTFRNQEDYVSKYRRVLDYFDAVKVGLTATPALHTADIFGDPIFRYSYREAVIDGYLIDHEPPVQITTALARAGIVFAKDEQLDLLNTKTGEIDLAHAPDELRFEVEQFNRQVITPEFNRVVAEELAKHIDPALPGKTLIFAATDAHADMVVAALKKAFVDAYGEVDDAAVKKITGSVDKVKGLIRSFRNDSDPKVAVTVDLLTTGIDVPKIVNLVFLRRVNSRILYEQMIGRGTRQCPEIGKEVFRIFDAVDLYPHLQDLTEMKPVVVNPSIGFEQLISEMIGATTNAQRETIREQFIVKLRRRLRSMPDEARQNFEAVAGETPAAMLKRLLEGDAPDLAAWLKARSAIGPILDWRGDGADQPYLPISPHPDHIVDVSRGYGKAKRPEDFLDSFAAFVRDNQNTIAALKLVVQRPRDLTRADLRELRLALDRNGYSEANLRRAWMEAKNEEIAASIIGFVRQAALGDPLVPYAERVKAAMNRIMKSRQWTDPQKRWLARIGEQVEKEIVVDRQAFDGDPFAKDGGFNRLNKVFGGELENIVASINEEMWAKAS